MFLFKNPGTNTIKAITCLAFKFSIMYGKKSQYIKYQYINFQIINNQNIYFFMEIRDSI